MCSLASLLFLRFGTLPFFTPEPRLKKKKKKKSKKTGSAMDKLRRLVLGKAGTKDKVVPGEEMRSPMEGGEEEKEKGREEEEEQEERERSEWTKEEGPELEWEPEGAIEQPGPGPAGAGVAKSRSTSDLCGQEDRRSGGWDVVQQEEGRQELIASVPARRKKSFKICKCYASSTDLLDLNTVSTRTDDIAAEQDQQQQQQEQQQQMAMGTNATSRFKIIPVENRYKKGRWEVWDYYEGTDTRRSSGHGKAEEGRLASPNSLEKQQPANGNRANGQPGSRRNSFQLVTIRRSPEGRRLSGSAPNAGAEGASVGEDGLSRSTTPRIVEPAPVVAGGRRPIDGQPQQGEEEQGQRGMIVLRASGEFAAPPAEPTPLCRPVTPSQMLIQQLGLERSLTMGLTPADSPQLPPGSPSALSQQQLQFSASFGPGQMNHLPDRRAVLLMRRSSSASTGAVPHCSAAQRSEGAAIAIDSKIEQAMDLVKTHLIYAVRDEIELLRTRIVELEATVMQLEIENAILREHIAPELLDGLEKPPPPLQIRTPAQQHTAALAQ